MSVLNRINIVVPGSSTNALNDRDTMITVLKTMFPGTWSFYHYTDTASGNGAWWYYAIGSSVASGIVTLATVSCSGMLHPPSGSNMVAVADPGLGTTYTWYQTGAPFNLSASSPGGGSVSVPQGNNNFYVWNIAGNSSTAVADFTAACTVVSAALAGPGLSSTVVSKYLNYVDSVSGAWQVWFIVFGPGVTEWGSTSTVSILPSSNILYAVTCAGSPHPPTGSPMPAVTQPAFTQTFTTLSAPLSFGPQR